MFAISRTGEPATRGIRAATYTACNGFFTQRLGAGAFRGLTSVGACSYTVRFARLAPIGFAPRSGGLVSGVLDSTSLLLFTTLLFTTLLFTTLLLSCFIGSPAPSMVPFKGLGLQPLVPFKGSTPLMRPAALETNCRQTRDGRARVST